MRVCVRVCEGQESSERMLHFYPIGYLQFYYNSLYYYSNVSNVYFQCILLYGFITPVPCCSDRS